MNEKDITVAKGDARTWTSADMQYLVTLGYDLSEQVKPYFEKIGDETYLVNPRTGSMERIEIPIPYAPPKFEVYSLDGIIEYIKRDPDGHTDRYDGRVVLRVDGVDRVSLHSPVYGPRNTRSELAVCTCAYDSFPFDSWIDPEMFVILMQTRFVETDARQTVLSIVSNLSDEQTMQTTDDNITQRLTVNKGVSMKGETQFVNPVPLQPYRTFNEVVQPESPFVLRVRSQGGVEVGLFEADCGTWKIDAVRTIKEYLYTNLKKQIDGGSVALIF